MLQSLAITRGIARPWRPESSKLSKWQIAAQDCESRASKGFCYGHEYSRLRISARAVGENQAFAGGRLVAMQESVNRRVARLIGKRFYLAHEDYRLSEIHPLSQ